ncbi:hypothetical protein GALMADRAFT_241175 [Galerina marginata CBS 339.88]|uniref:Serine/threonine-protein kinase Tel1 n=1 Tax=Galerina marginata (strain CBS 339.88) TaxID=685588 RepID=A0A067TP37_GALM3|nr:hypothetical protein GALMADRAFT_241175 [Galerina marginata CBS 339.88]
MSNLRAVLDSLKSDKIKERQEALTSLREVFSQDKVLQQFHISQKGGQSTPTLWLPVFQALFHTVMLEKATATKKSNAKSGTSSAAALRRLSDAASTVRWLTERAIAFMNRKVVMALVQHLTQMLSSDRTPNAQLFIPVALDYAKALKCIVSHTPHLEHLDDDTWVKIVEIAVNIVLDDPINSSFAGREDETPMHGADSDMYAEDETVDELEDSDDLPASVAVNSKKRPRREPAPIPIVSPRKSKPQGRGRRNVVISVSLEQVEFASLLSIMVASPVAPLLSKEHSGLASGLLMRLERFLERYPADSSLLHDYLIILISTLRHLSLNKKYEIERFARSTWSALVGLWGTKDRRLKESLIVVLRYLFQFTICPSYTEQPKLPSFDCAEEIGRLQDWLDGEAESRWGVDGLSLDSLRLQVDDIKDNKSSVPNREEAFVAKTFRAGWDFDSDQALSWAIIELQADCAGKLLQLSESMHSTMAGGSSRSESKRVKLLDPVSALLNSIQATCPPNVRSYRLQTMLFFIDRHWDIVHNSLKERIINVLLQYVAFDHATVQSWVFVNFAAIAYAEGSRISISSPLIKRLDPAIWDSIWTHAIRRANVPTVCRAACHAGQTLLAQFHSPSAKPSHPLLNSHRVLLEIETLTKDMDVQGPSYPFDSVCLFLSRCLTIASQDVRLYRMRLEDKVLSWFVDTWKITGNRMKMASHSMQDILDLLETICALPKRVDLIVQPLLPHSEIVDTIIEENGVKVIQDYVLYAKLPSFAQKYDRQRVLYPNANDSISITASKIDRFDRIQLVPPRGRERKISSFLLRTLESLVHDWESLRESNNHPGAEMARQSLDFAITALAFESLLAFNGTSSTRQVLQSAANLISIITPLLTDSRWTTPEKLLVAHAYEVLVGDEQIDQEETFSDGLSPPGPDSGIKEQILQSLLFGQVVDEKHSRSCRIKFLRLVWQNVEMQDSFDGALKTLRKVLSQLLNGSSGDPNEQAMNDEKDGFGPIRTTNLQRSTPNPRADDNRSTKHLFQICISVLACGPFLQSPSAEPTRDKNLTQLVLDNARTHPHKFSLLCPLLFGKARQGILYLSVKTLDSFFDEFESLLGQYAFSRSERFQQLLLDLLISSLGIWKNEDTRAPEVHGKFLQLCRWLSEQYIMEKIRSWSLRDAFARFLDRFLSEDPAQVSWIPPEEFEEVEDYQALLPTSLLPKMNMDPDLRVRFRAAVLNARLFSLCQRIDQAPLDRYMLIKNSLTSEVDNSEYMLTRMLALGNIMIVSSAVRRGPYWHLLETCLFSRLYSNHIEAILNGVSERLGMFSLSSLFEAYASQLAYSIRKAEADFLAFPPHLLGYRDRKQAAEATFRAFTPTNIITNGEKLFESHCQVLQKTPIEGLQECFGDIVGFLIAYVIHDDDIPNEALDELIKEKMNSIPDLTKTLADNANGIIIRILRSLSDQDCSESGPITAALLSFDPSGKAARTFNSLTVYRGSDTFERHTPNLPAFPTDVILRSLDWLSSRIPNAFNNATTYHVTQELMNDIHRTPLVNEQSRLINGLTLWLAFRSQDLEDPSIMPTLVHGATLLLSQSDLARSAQSILDCIFRSYRKLVVKDLRLPNVLIRICSIAQDYASNVNDCSNSEIGINLVQWIDQQAYALSKVPALRSLILRALPAWPQQPSPKLLPLYDETTLHNLSSILEDHRITSNKFRLVRRFKDHATERNYDEEQFSKTFFWRLKECMPSLERLQDEDVAAFADLLSLHYGKIDSFNIEQPNLNDPRPRHRRMFKRNGSTDSTYAARDAITLGLLVMLEGDEPSKVSNAYHTLRLIMAVPSPPLLLPSDYRAGLEFLKTHLLVPRTRAIVDIQDMLQSEVYLDAANNFSGWITLITILLSDALAAIDPFFGQLSSIFFSDIVFAEETLPIIVHTLLYCKTDTPAGRIPCKKVLSNYFTAILLSASTDISCVRSIVDIVLHLRNFTGKGNDQLGYNKWLEIDFTLLARSAILCGAYTTALLFIELASEREIQNAEECKTIEGVLYEIYAHIDEPDGFYGIKTHDLHQFLIKRFHHEHQWDKAFQFHGAALEAGETQKGEEEGLLKSFHSFGFDHLAIDTLRNLAGDSPDSTSSSMSYILGWRTETWDLPDAAQEISGAPLYRSLRSIYRERDPRILESNIRSSLFQEMGHLRSLGSENLTEIRTVSRDLMCLGQVIQWRQDAVQDLLKPENISLDKLKDFTDIDARFEFADLESIMATRISLLRSVRQREERQQIGSLVSPFVQHLKDIEKTCLLRLSEAARASRRVQIALNSVVKAQRLDVVPSPKVSEEFANVLWLQREEKLAVQFLQDLANQDKSEGKGKPADSLQRALWLSRLGTWTSEACLAKPTEIQERYFSPSITLLENIQGGSEQSGIAEASATIYREFAMFAERQYHATSKSPDAIRWKVYVERKKQEIEHRSMELARTQTDATRQQTLKGDQDRARKILNEDSEQFKKHNSLRETFLKQAIDMHSRCLSTSNKFDNDSAIRFCSLWFANFDDLSILDCVKGGLERIPSRKFIFLAHQLTARVSNPSSTVLPAAQENLQNLILRMCREHPFHILYQIYCLSDHPEPDNGGRRQSGRQSAQSTQTERGLAATSILDRLRNEPGASSSKVQDVERLCGAYLQWAKFPISGNNLYKTKTGPFPVPSSSLKLLDIQNLHVPVSTVRTPIDPTMQYQDCIWIQRYDHEFYTAGGVNLPKIVVCYGSDGKKYKQLFKGEGKDDLRQDAVMEQVFELVNSLLQHDRETRRRTLRVRDYKVIPLASQAGLLEFVGNTSPMRDWLSQAHPRYRPQDLKPAEITSRIKKAQQVYHGRHDKQLEVFLQAREKFKPVMRHYFTEKHKTPISWFQMRLCYTHSVATTSIVGHVLGLGDRHTSNILMDNVLGEVVHIDLGIAFDQGKLLPIPERVPFRMTADIVDGMGISGTSGVFQRCAEETLRVLREESELIMTVLEVFKHDPLHSWTASEVKVKQAQSDVPLATVNDTARFNLGIGIDMSSGTADEAADRALSSVARKLDKSLSVESTVNELIAEATDPMNLATIFQGWMPHM